MPIDLVEELKKREEKRDELQRRKTRLQLIREQAEESREKLKKDMAEEGISPETLDEDLKKSEDWAKETLQKVDEDLLKYESIILSAEKSLEEGESCPPKEAVAQTDSLL